MTRLRDAWAVLTGRKVAVAPATGEMVLNYTGAYGMTIGPITYTNGGFTNGGFIPPG